MPAEFVQAASLILALVQQAVNARKAVPNFVVAAIMLLASVPLYGLGIGGWRWQDAAFYAAALGWAVQLRGFAGFASDFGLAPHTDTK